jgi:hypothetical protein
MKKLFLVGAALLVLTSVANAQSVPSAAENAACNAVPNPGRCSGASCTRIYRENPLCSQLRNQRIDADRITEGAASARRLAEQNKENADRAIRYQVEQKAQEEEAAKPENILQVAYGNYIGTKQCFEWRQGYLEVYISEPEMENARKYIAAIDKKLNVPTKDIIWSKAAITASGITNTSIFVAANGIGMTPRMSCQLFYAKVQSIYTDMFPAASRVKKDF